MVLVKNSKYLVTGSSDSELRMWEIKDAQNSPDISSAARDETQGEVIGDELQSDVAVCISLLIFWIS